MRHSLSLYLGTAVLFCLNILYFGTVLIHYDKGATTTRLGSNVAFQESLSNFPPLLPLQRGPDPYVLEDNSANLCNDTTHAAGFRQRSGLFCIIAGIQHSGTTMTASLLMNAPNLYGAFELGLLLAPTPSEFSNPKRVNQFFYDGLTNPTTNHWWGLREAQRDEVVNTECIAKQYALLHQHSPIYKTLNTSWIVDKTPAYFENLYAIMAKTPGVPVIVTQKDDASIRQSFHKRGHSGAISKLRIFHRQVQKCRKHFPDRLFVLDYTAFAKDPHVHMDRMFAFLGLQWDPTYLNNERFNAKGKLFGRPTAPGFNATRSECHDCVSNPYGQ